MYSVFYKDTANGATTYKFMSCMMNKLTDKIFTNSINNLGWVIDDCKVYSYLQVDEAKYFEFMKWHDDRIGNHKFYVDVADGVLKKVIMTRGRFDLKDTELPFDHTDAAATYTAQEIADYDANIAHWDGWVAHADYNAASTDPYADMVAHVYGDWPNVWPTPKKKDFIFEPIFTVQDSIVGTLVDINAKIAAEAL